MNISQRQEFLYWYAGLAMLGLIVKETDAIDTRKLAVESVMCADALIKRLDEKEKGGQDE